MKEHLARFHAKDGLLIDMHRVDRDIILSSKDGELKIAKATGKQALDLISVFEGLVESVEYPEGEEK